MNRLLPFLLLTALVVPATAQTVTLPTDGQATLMNNGQITLLNNLTLIGTFTAETGTTLRFEGTG